MKALQPRVRVIGVEPAGAAAMTASLAAGKPVTIDGPKSVADGLAAPFAGEHTLAHVQALVDEVVVVSDDDIVAAIPLVLQRTKLFAEPAAVASVAPLLSGAVNVGPGQRVVCVLSGGNADVAGLARLL
jgi:threonine dehydratase